MRERNIDRLPLAHAPTGDQTHNPGLCPDWKLNWQPFALQDDAPPAEADWSGNNYTSEAVLSLSFCR